MALNTATQIRATPKPPVDGKPMYLVGLWRLLLWLLTVATTSACHETPSPPTDDATFQTCPPVTALPTLLAEKYCMFEAAEPHWHRNVYGDCRTYFEVSFPTFLRERIHLVEVGKVSYDCAAAAECLAAAASKSAVFIAAGGIGIHNKAGVEWIGGGHVSDACRHAFSGHAVVGASCEDDAECETGLRCWGCPGVCAVPVQREVPCGRDAVCSDADTCMDGRCAALPTNLPAGATCIAHDVPREDYYATGFQCATGLDCVPWADATGDWRCRKRGHAAAGSACENDWDCEMWRCNDGKCAPQPFAPADGTSCAVFHTKPGHDDGCEPKACLPVGGGDRVCWSGSQPKLPCGPIGCEDTEYCRYRGGSSTKRPMY